MIPELGQLALILALALALVQATLPLLDPTPDKAVEVAYGILDEFGKTFVAEHTALWRAKLGLRDAREKDTELVSALLMVLNQSKADFTNVFRALANPAAARVIRTLLTDSIFGLDSSSAMICIALIFGAPETVPAGKHERSAS